ncbi:MAG: formylglycine-generating enzyme family protein [Pirellulales bacterium]|jgi:formylglycine-generating enzyme required for sulfatase activity
MRLLFLISALVVFAQESQAEEPTSTKLLTTFRQEFVAIKPGQFMMGRNPGEDNQRPAHLVKIERGFQMAKYEVTQNLYQAVMNTDPSRWKGPRNSVEMTTHADAVLFCKQATKMMRKQKLISKDQTIRLPSEAEWEYCARAGTSTDYSFGDDLKLLDDYGWHTGNAAGNDPPVGAKKPNPWGLYDMHGYLWEWCADSWMENYQKTPRDQTALQVKTATDFVVRGGSWKDKADMCTSGFRLGLAKDAKDAAVGFRCVLE